MSHDEQPHLLLKMSLVELWELFPIILSPFNPLWGEWFEEEKSFLLKQLACEKVLRISHIGSTAIGGIWAKPIIDILVEIPREASLSQFKEKLLEAGYLCMNETPTRISLNKGYTLQGFAEKVFHRVCHGAHPEADDHHAPTTWQERRCHPSPSGFLARAQP